MEVTGPGRTVYFAGQLGIDKSGKMGANAREQMEIAFENVKAALASVGTGFEHVVKLNNYIVDIGDEMRAEKTGEGWRVFVTAGGIPRGGATAADCTLITVGEIKGNTFQGEIKYQPAPDEKPGPDNAVESGHKMTIAFAPEFATLTAADVGLLCGNGTGIFGRYTKDRR